jgi:hypothetical protein
MSDSNKVNAAHADQIEKPPVKAPSSGILSQKQTVPMTPQNGDQASYFQAFVHQKKETDRQSTLAWR